MKIIDYNGKEIKNGIHVKYVGTHSIGKVEKIKDYGQDEDERPSQIFVHPEIPPINFPHCLHHYQRGSKNIKRPENQGPSNHAIAKSAAQSGQSICRSTGAGHADDR